MWSSSRRLTLVTNPGGDRVDPTLVAAALAAVTLYLDSQEAERDRLVGSRWTQAGRLEALTPFDRSVEAAGYGRA